MGPPRATFHGFIVTQSELDLSSRWELRRAWQPIHEPKTRLPAWSRSVFTDRKPCGRIQDRHCPLAIGDNKLSSYNRHMYIPRDITATLAENHSPVQLLTGPQRILLSHLSQGSLTEITFDDLQMRTLAHRDPGLFFEQFTPPVLLDPIARQTSPIRAGKDSADGMAVPVVAFNVASSAVRCIVESQR